MRVKGWWQKKSRFTSIGFHRLSPIATKMIALRSPADDSRIISFLKLLTKSKEDWQVNQAREALRLYHYYLAQATQEESPPGADTDSDAAWRAVQDGRDTINQKKMLKKTMGFAALYPSYGYGQTIVEQTACVKKTGWSREAAAGFLD